MERNRLKNLIILFSFSFLFSFLLSGEKKIKTKTEYSYNIIQQHIGKDISVLRDKAISEFDQNNNLINKTIYYHN